MPAAVGVGTSWARDWEVDVRTRGESQKEPIASRTTGTSNAVERGCGGCSLTSSTGTGRPRLGFAGLLVALLLLAPLLERTDAQGRGLLYFGFFFFLFWAGFVGVGNAMADRKGLRAMQVLPLRSRDIARALWFGAIAPGALLGVVACGALLAATAIPGFETEFPIGLDRLLGLGALTVLWGCGLAGIAWGVLQMVGRHDTTLAFGAAMLLFIVAAVAILAPIWIGAVAPDWSFGAWR